MLKLPRVFFLLVLFSCTKRAPDPEITNQRIKILFGDLHTHSNISDGTISPDKAYEQAKGNGLDFLALNEHIHFFYKTREKLERMRHLLPLPLYTNTKLTKEARLDVLKASSDKKREEFFSLSGLEYYLVRKLNSISFTNYHNLIPQDDFRTLPLFLKDVALAKKNKVIAGAFLHPLGLKDDYGFSKHFGGDSKEFVKAWAPLVSMISVACPKMDHRKYFWKPELKNIYSAFNSDFVQRWKKYLSMGLKLAPIYNQCSHSSVIGDRFSGRTAVYIKGKKTKENFLKALVNRNIYATEDPNLKIYIQTVDGYLPGDQFVLPKGSIDLKITIDDSDEPDARYKFFVEKFYSNEQFNMTGQLQVESKKLKNNKFEINIPFLMGQKGYVILSIKQISKDPINNSSVNSAYAAPFWILN